MPRKGVTTLAALLVFGVPSAGLADAESQPAIQSAFCRDGMARTAIVWIKLTEPSGKLIHINVDHVTSVRSDTQVPGARTQLDLTSGKFQGVQEDIEQVMRLISSAPGARETDETPSTVL